MSYTEMPLKVNALAAGDLSGDQYKFMVTNSSGQIARATTLGQAAEYVLQNNDSDAAGKRATVAFGGITKVYCSGTIAQGALVTTDANGEAVLAATGHYILGKLLEAGAADKVAAMLMFSPGRVA